MSTGTKAKDCDGPLYPQWGDARGVGTDTSTDTDPDTSAGAIDSAESWREDDSPEPWGPDAGATTAEYAITTLAACGFAALLVVILKSEPIKELVTGVIQTALGLGA
ncbi:MULTISPECIES: DUF4244 domain-containing protein [unclassified Brevibacterium]|uniref:DUF4244 domain-containing protein n=1 Tax=unclassified Brevibacterium TaxID=2614124 RepID=UPI0018660339|nr:MULTISPECIES: DUF4244 domain-containing protein [unclassified Brevibacterium]